MYDMYSRYLERSYQQPEAKSYRIYVQYVCRYTYIHYTHFGNFL
jgi:hypothetical protein